MRIAAFLFLVAITACVAHAARSSTRPATKPASMPVDLAQMVKIGPDGQIMRIPPKAKISKEAQAVMDQMRDAYGKLKSLELAGAISGDFDVAGQKQQPSEKFAGLYAAPNRFRHEIKGGILVGSTGTKAFVFDSTDKHYVMKDAPKEKTAGKDLPAPIADVLGLLGTSDSPASNPSLLLAIVKDPSAELAAGMSEVNKGEDVTVDDTRYTSLQLTASDGGKLTMLVDPRTHLVRRVQTDLKDVMQKRGAPQVKSAQITVDYTTVNTDVQLEATRFDWAPPEGARDASAVASEDDDQKGGGAMAMVGEKAPDFTLVDMAGKPVKLSATKGSVVVLDFWATWCPPCQKSLPHLADIAANQEWQKNGLKVFAIDIREEKDKVSAFLADRKLKLNVLLDSDAAVSEKYKVSGIPQTVVIGKDGAIKKVFVGFGEGGQADLKTAIGEALREGVAAPVE